jgi:hypothetical protein
VDEPGFFHELLLGGRYGGAMMVSGSVKRLYRSQSRLWLISSIASWIIALSDPTDLE